MNYHLPEPLAERSVMLTRPSTPAKGEFVLYWAHHALRAHQNPALEAAATIALEMELPLLVYQGLGGRHRYNSDRHHRFILECARDFDAGLRELGLHLHFHLPLIPAEKGPLAGLLERAAFAVSEIFPVPPFKNWYRQHAEANPDLPWLLVDSSCLLPMPLSKSRPTRAFQFRNTHLQDIEKRVLDGWPELLRWPQPFTGDAGFKPFELQKSFEEAIAACHIDHSIPPIADNTGGTVAAYRRWTEFLSGGLDQYHHLRDDAALPGAVSRMSAYLHYGCVSPFRIASEAMENGGEGAKKFLDELLVWRELSHHFCFHSDDLESLQVLPDWARESLVQHEADPRSSFDWEMLCRARTGAPLWDLAQTSLLRRGELHNNTRMTWGKAFLQWTQRPQRAQKLMIDLNHRFALDGNDPNSYGGLLWCLGQFDRAFPAGPVFGKVRQRSISRHAQRLDLGRYAQIVSEPANGRRLRVIVVGAGMAGLTAARTLGDQGHEVVVLEKARGPGGRMSTRRKDGFRFDHGAQYFTARDPRFRRHVMAWQERGLVERWEARIGVATGDDIERVSQATERFVPVPSMNQVCRELLQDLEDCRFDWQARSFDYENRKWTVQSDSGDSVEGDVLILTPPPEQVRSLLADHEVDAALQSLEMRPCWAVMAVLDRPLFADWDALFVNHGPLSWVAGQAGRPGRPAADAWVLHGSPDWSQDHLEDGPETVRDQLLDAARQLPGVSQFKVLEADAHRWRYALAREPLNQGAFWFGSKRLAVAGDWCYGSKVEGAFLSGIAAAGRVMGADLTR
ncbi:FAD-dependent oxidoreductase [Pseudomonadota bacterium]